MSVINDNLVTMEQINAMRNTLGPEFPRVEGQRADGTLVCALMYSPDIAATAQGYVAIRTNGQIIPDSKYSYRSRRFVMASRSWA